MTTSVGRVIEALERRYPPGLAADWDAVGLVCGEPQASVSKVLFAVDPVMSIVDEALSIGADMIVTHHPLLLHGVHSVAATTPKGRVVHTLIGHGIALYCAHTNADHARPGVSDALAEACGVQDTTAIDPVGAREGTGKVGALPNPVRLGDLAARIVTVLPPTPHGIRVAGDLDSTVRTVAVCAGAGDSLLEMVGGSADVYVTSDPRHHRAQDHLMASGAALIDIPHWAAEWLWLPVAASALAQDLDGDSVTTVVSLIDTSPWTAHMGGSR